MKRRTQITTLLLASTLSTSNLQATPQNVKAKILVASASARAALQSGLMKAIAAHNLPQIKIWLARGAQISLPDKSRTTPFIEAVTKGDVAVVQLLFLRGARVNARNQEGASALQLASAMGNLKITKLLLDKGALVNVADKYGKTFLIDLVETAEENVEEIAKLLLNRGANVNARNKVGGTAIYYASVHGEASLVKLFGAAKANVNTADKQGMTPLMTAALMRQIEIVRLLLHAGADVLAKDKRGATVLSSTKDWFLVGDLLTNSGQKATAQESMSRMKDQQILAMLEAAEKRANRKKYLTYKGTQ